MYAYEATFALQGASVGTEENNPTEAVIIFAIGGGLQVGPDQVMPLPLGVHKYKIPKKPLADLIGALQQAHDHLRDESDIIAATPADVERVARIDGAIRGS